MKRFLPVLLLLVALGGGGWWWHRADEARAARAWQPLTGGGAARILTVTHGTVHQYQAPPPTFLKRINYAIRTRSMVPLRQPPTGGMGAFGSTMTTGRPGLGVWLELRGAPQSALPQEAELILPGGHTFYSHGASGSTGPGGFYRTTTIFDYIPARPKTLRYACKLNGQRVEFEFDNPACRTDLPVWEGAPLPQTQQHGPLSLTLRAVQLARGPNYFHHTGEEWLAHPAWSITKDGQPADAWFAMNVVYEDPSGQSLRECGLFEEPVWKVRCTVSRTHTYPFRDDEVQWLGTVAPDAPPEQTSRLFSFDSTTQPNGLKLAGVFGPGEYQYQDGAIVETGPPVKIDPRTHPKMQDDRTTKKVRITLEKPAVVFFGPAFLILRDSAGHPTEFGSQYTYYGSTQVEIYELPKAPIRIGLASSVEPGAGEFEFFIPTPEKPGLKKPVAKP